MGLSTELIIDQHFQQRERLGRLLYAVSLHPGRTGIGIDEDTAAIITPDGILEVIGRGTVTIVDSSRLRTLGSTDIPDRHPLAFTNITIHALAQGWRFDLNRKTVLTNP
jgi:cyanophycinase